MTYEKVRLICSKGIKRCFNGFVSPEFSLITNFFEIYQDLVLFLRQNAGKIVDNVVESGYQN